MILLYSDGLWDMHYVDASGKEISAMRRLPQPQKSAEVAETELNSREVAKPVFKQLG